MHENQVNDELDQYLYQLPCDPAPEDLAVRINQTIKTRRRRNNGTRFTLSAALAFIGVWLILPGSQIWLEKMVSLPAGFDLLEGGLNFAAQDITTMVNQAMIGFSTFQNGLTTSLGVTPWLGLTLLSIGVLLSLGQFMKQIEA
jgi:hypothetical protein